MFGIVTIAPKYRVVFTSKRSFSTNWLSATGKVSSSNIEHPSSLTLVAVIHLFGIGVPTPDKLYASCSVQIFPISYKLFQVCNVISNTRCYKILQNIFI